MKVTYQFFCLFLVTSSLLGYPCMKKNMFATQNRDIFRRRQWCVYLFVENDNLHFNFNRTWFGHDRTSELQYQFCQTTIPAHFLKRPVRQYFFTETQRLKVLWKILSINPWYAMSFIAIFVKRKNAYLTLVLVASNPMLIASVRFFVLLAW